MRVTPTDKKIADDKMLISVVVPLYNEGENLPELYRRLTCSLEKEGEPFELVFVNDGSQDNTPQLLEELSQQDWRVLVIHLSRNFGHQAALSAGLNQARGQAVILMDGDLQDPPEVLGEFLSLWRRGSDVVYAIRTFRKEALWKRCAYALFYRLWRAWSDLDIPLDSGDFCLMDRAVVDVINKMPEGRRFVRGLRSFAGFRQTGIRYQRAARLAGQPKYTMRALIRLALDGLIGFSSFPLALITYLGLALMALALILGGWLGVRFLSGPPPSGWSLTLVAVFMTGALHLLSLGIIGQYLRHVFLETKGRPTYIVAPGDKQAVTAAREEG